MPKEATRDEATRMVETILNLKREKVVTDAEARAAVEKVPFYSDVLKSAA